MIPTTLERQAESIERWKSAKGIEGRNYVPANNGARRTASKRALLKALSDLAVACGVSPPFSAKF